MVGYSANKHINVKGNKSPYDGTHEQKHKLRISGAECTETGTFRSNREGRRIIPALGSTQGVDGWIIYSLPI
jgi:hypothetical protein